MEAIDIYKGFKFRLYPNNMQSKKINKNFNSTKTLYLQGKPRIFWKIKKKYEKIKTKIEEKYKKENRREKTWSIRILIKMEMQLW